MASALHTAAVAGKLSARTPSLGPRPAPSPSCSVRGAHPAAGGVDSTLSAGWSASRARSRDWGSSRPGVVRVRAGADDEGFVGKLSKLNPFGKKAQESRALERQRQEESNVLDQAAGEQLFGKGLIGKLATSAINAGARALKSTMEEAQKGVTECYDDAVREVRLDPLVLERLGGSVECTPPMTQASSSSNINGVATTRTTVVFLVQGANGRRATATATKVSGGSVRDGLEVTMAYDDGLTQQLGGGASGSAGGSGGIIDIDADGVIDV